MPSSAQRARQYWLMKSEPDEASIDDLAREGTLPWTGVRNYQARNFMRDQMRIGDGVLFYHSSCPEPGIAGLAEVCSQPYPDSTQFDPKSDYYDSASKQDNPRWSLVDVSFVRKSTLIPSRHCASTMRWPTWSCSAAAIVSITPVTPAEWRYITEKLMK
jgi:predicted RNA-binding protein with PUA-like domain